MSRNNSPSIVTNGLVMYYDMSNTSKSFNGAPTTNYVDPKWISWSVDGSGQAAIGTRTIVSVYSCVINDIASNTRQSIMVLGLSASTTYTFSVKFNKINGAPTLRFQLQSYNGATFISSAFPTTVQLGLTDIYGWQTAYYTYTTAAGADRVMWFMQDGDDYTTYTHAFELKEPQAELGSFATPFVNGSRSTTQAIRDLTGNNTMTASSLTYASNNTFSFNGSTNYMTVGNTGITHGTNDWTYTMWANWSAITSLGTIYENGLWTNSLLLRFETSGFTVYSMGTLWGTLSFTPTLNTWYHLAFVRSSTNVYLYVNGVLTATVASFTATIVPGTSLIYIGMSQHAAGQCFNGKLAAGSIYVRALSITEVVQNFNALRGRYGI